MKQNDPSEHINEEGQSKSAGVLSSWARDQDFALAYNTLYNLKERKKSGEARDAWKLAREAGPPSFCFLLYPLGRLWTEYTQNHKNASLSSEGYVWFLYKHDVIWWVLYGKNAYRYPQKCV